MAWGYVRELKGAWYLGSSGGGRGGCVDYPCRCACGGEGYGRGCNCSCGGIGCYTRGRSSCSAAYTRVGRDIQSVAFATYAAVMLEDDYHSRLSGREREGIGIVYT